MSGDGRAQRRALTAAEQAIAALAAGDGDRALAAAASAADLDQVGVFTALPAAVEAAAADLAASGTITGRSWDVVAAAVGPGPLAFAVESARSKP